MSTGAIGSQVADIAMRASEQIDRASVLADAQGRLGTRNLQRSLVSSARLQATALHHDLTELTSDLDVDAIRTAANRAGADGPEDLPKEDAQAALGLIDARSKLGAAISKTSPERVYENGVPYVNLSHAAADLNDAASYARFGSPNSELPSLEEGWEAG